MISVDYEIVESEGPMAIGRTVRGYRALCVYCEWAGPFQLHRIDAEDDFDQHQH